MYAWPSLSKTYPGLWKFASIRVYPQSIWDYKQGHSTIKWIHSRILKVIDETQI